MFQCVSISGFQVLQLPSGGPYISLCVVYFVMHISALFSQAILVVSLAIQELPRASGPLGGFLCLLLATMYESKLNSVSGFSFCIAWGLEEEELAYQSTSLSWSFLLLVTLREVPDLSRRGWL